MPAKVFAGPEAFALQGMRQVNVAMAVGKILSMQIFEDFHIVLQPGVKTFGKKSDPLSAVTYINLHFAENPGPGPATAAMPSGAIRCRKAASQS
jgi:hypothetical protein